MNELDSQVFDQGASSLTSTQTKSSDKAPDDKAGSGKAASDKASGDDQTAPPPPKAKNEDVP